MKRIILFVFTLLPAISSAQQILPLVDGTIGAETALPSRITNAAIVGLGEESHGAAEMNLARASLVKRLHEEHGFDVLAFESPLYEAYVWGKNDTASPGEHLAGGIYRIWHTPDLLALFEYAHASRKTSHPLYITGFDIQIASLYGAKSRPGFLRQCLLPADSALAEKIFSMDAELANDSNVRFREGEKYPHLPFAPGSKWREPYISTYLEAAAALDELIGRGIKDTAHRLDALVAAQVLRSIAANTQSYVNETPVATFFRDTAMALNVRFIREQMYPGKKLILWAHNTHLFKNNATIMDMPYGKTMGTFLYAMYGRSYVVVGSFMGGGKAHRTNRTTYEIQEADSLDGMVVKMRMVRKGNYLCVLPENSRKKWRWIGEDKAYMHWGLYPVRFRLRDQVDAYLFFPVVHPPTYID